MVLVLVDMNILYGATVPFLRFLSPEPLCAFVVTKTYNKYVGHLSSEMMMPMKYYRYRSKKEKFVRKQFYLDQKSVFAVKDPTRVKCLNKFTFTYSSTFWHTKLCFIVIKLKAKKMWP